MLAQHSVPARTTAPGRKHAYNYCAVGTAGPVRTAEPERAGAPMDAQALAAASAAGAAAEPGGGSSRLT